MPSDDENLKNETMDLGWREEVDTKVDFDNCSLLSAGTKGKEWLLLPIWRGRKAVVLSVYPEA